MHILQVVIKNTSTIDFTLPLLWKLRRENSDARISVLYCVFDKRQILRKSSYFSEVFGGIGARQYDFADFLKKPYNFISPLLRSLFSESPADKFHFREIYKNHAKAASLWGAFSFLTYLFKNYSAISILSNIIRNALVSIERRVGEKIIRLDSILPELDADIVLFDNRSVTNFYGRDLFYRYFDEKKRPVVLLPHGPHFRDPVSEFCPFDEKGDPLPDYCDFWMPLRFGTPWVEAPERRDQFAIVGYPGLDSEWLEYLRSGSGGKTPIAKRDGGGRKKCLFIIRRYLPEGEERSPDLDPFIIDYDDFMQPLKMLSDAIRRVDEEIELIVKPHPVNNYKVLAGDFEKAGIKYWRISYEPIYALMEEVDIVVSLFSTILLVPVMAGIPTIVTNTKLQEHVHKGWNLLEKMYTGMQFYLKNVNQLPDTFCDVLSMVKSGDSEKYCKDDIKHLRYYFPDGAMDSAEKRIYALAGTKRDPSGFNLTG